MGFCSKKDNAAEAKEDGARSKDAKPKSKNGCCSKNKDKPEGKKKDSNNSKKRCCSKNKNNPEGKKKDSKNSKKRCCSKKKDKDKRSAEDGGSNTEPNATITFCCCCICIKAIFPDSDPEANLAHNQKCCAKKCKIKWCQLLCILIWIVIVVSAILLIVFTVKCWKYLDAALSRGDTVGWWMTFAYILFVILSSLLFLLFAKLQCGSGCCFYYGIIWIIIHVAFGFVTYGYVYSTPAPDYRRVVGEYEDAMQGSNAPNPGPGWLVYIQKEHFCCLMSSDGTQHYETKPGYAALCAANVDNSTGKYNGNVEASPTELVKTCETLLSEIYRKCLNLATGITLSLMVLGVIPLVVYCKIYQKARIAPGDNEGSIKEDQPTGEQAPEPTPDEKKDQKKKNSNRDDQKGPNGKTNGNNKKASNSKEKPNASKSHTKSSAPDKNNNTESKKN